MKLASLCTWLSVTSALVCCGGVLAAEPTAPKVSTFAPADDLATQVDFYVGRLEKSTESEADYLDAVDKVANDGNTLILIALALGLHDTANKYQAAAPALVRGAQQVAAAKDYASAQAGVAAVKAALAAQGDPTALKWTKLASLPELMKQVPLINSRLKRHLRKFEAKAEVNVGDTAVLAAIAQGSMHNVDQTILPAESQKWFDYCVQFRNTAAAVNAAIHKKDQAATEAGMKDLTQSCEDCHSIFHPGGSLEVEEK